jgi:hypothetical protein
MYKLCNKSFGRITFTLRYGFNVINIMVHTIFKKIIISRSRVHLEKIRVT